MAKKIVSTEEQIENFLSDPKHAKNHYNHLKEEWYQIPSGSLYLDAAMEGGLPPGVHRFTGVTEGGKTSCALAFAKNFQEMFENSMVVYIRAEGRLTPKHLKRSGINTDPKRFFILDTNVFETAFEFIRKLVFENDEKKKYFFIVDSVDALGREDDMKKAFGDSDQVAGGALISSVFLKKMVLPIMKTNHVVILTSQVRVEVSPNAGRGGPKKKEAGGNAVKHYSSHILEFCERFESKDVIWENPNPETIDLRGEPIGHICKIKFRKSVNEKSGASVRYPIKYGRTNGKSVWVEREVIELMGLWGFCEKAGSWYKFDEEILKDAEKAGIDCPKSVQGLDKLTSLIESNEDLMNLIKDKILEEIEKS